MGRLTRDCLVKAYGDNNDKKMARFSMAVDRRGKHEEGQQSADFIPCVCYGKLADFADNYLRQGTKILLKGRIQTGSYTNKDGQKVYTTDVVAEEIEFAESKKTSGDTPAPAKAAEPARNTDTSFMDIPDGVEEQLPWT